MDRSDAERAAPEAGCRSVHWSAVLRVSALPAAVDALGGLLAAERERWALWLPVGLATGIALYFALPTEPPLVLSVLLMVLALLAMLAGVVVLHRAWGAPAVGQVLVIAGLAAATVAGGVALAGWHALDATAPVLERRLGPVGIEGRIVALEPGLKGARVTLEDPVIGRLSRDRTPKRVRLRLRGDAAGFHVGNRVRLFGVLMPPPSPAAPGAFDFARDAWFQQLGAVGFAFGDPKRLAGAPSEGIGARLGDWIADLRRDLYARVRAAVPGTAGAVAAALITGERGDIPPETMEDMRDSGLAHLLAISGLHVGLVTGALFVGLRALLAAFSGIALNYPIKKWAAFAALLGGAGYMLMTGATVPTQRAFLMVALVFLAVMVDRAAISMRLVAWAAAVVLAITPESLLGPSFQMSFAAVIALVATYEAARGPFARWRGEGGLLRRIGLYGAGVALTTLVAGTATAPFALYHFNQVAAFGLAANLGAVPITALWVMPLATIAFLLMPLGLEELALVPMGWGIDAVLVIAHGVAEWPGATLRAPQMPPLALALIVTGGLWLTLWRTRLRAFGVVVMAAGIAVAASARAPDILVAEDGRSFAVRDSDGRLVFGGRPLGSFERDIWLRRSGTEDDAADNAPDDAQDESDESVVPEIDIPKGDAGEVLRCDALACIYTANGFTVSVIRHPEAVAEDCRRAAVVISLVPLRRSACRTPRVLVDRFDLWRNGAHALWLDADWIEVRSVAAVRGHRPWTVAGPPRGFEKR